MKTLSAGAGQGIVDTAGRVKGQVTLHEVCEVVVLSRLMSGLVIVDI